MEQQQNDSAYAKASADKEKEVQAGQGTPASKEKQPRKKMSKGKIIGLVILVAIIWFIAIQIMAAETYKMTVQVKDEENIMGINPLGDSLDFGDLSRNLGATRYVALKNDSDKDRYILVWKRGEISDMVKLNKNNFTLEAGSEVKLEFSIQIPPSAEPKIYNGKATIFRWPKWF